MHAALGQPAGVLMPYVVPAQIDSVKGFTALERQSTTALLAADASRLDAVSAQLRVIPGRLEVLWRLNGRESS
jgi:hypothetical protein